MFISMSCSKQAYMAQGPPAYGSAPPAAYGSTPSAAYGSGGRFSEKSYNCCRLVKGRISIYI